MIINMLKTIGKKSIAEEQINASAIDINNKSKFA